MSILNDCLELFKELFGLFLDDFRVVFMAFCGRFCGLIWDFFMTCSKDCVRDCLD